jgi:hypothetical protein
VKGVGRSGGGLVVAVACHLLQHAPLDLVVRHDRDPAGRDRPQGGRAPPAVQQGHLPKDGTRPDLGHRPAVAQHQQHPVEQHKQPAARPALLDQVLARPQPDKPRPGANDHR